MREILDCRGDGGNSNGNSKREIKIGWCLNCGDPDGAGDSKEKN